MFLAMGIQSCAVTMQSSNTYRQRHTKHWHPITNTHHTRRQSECPQCLRRSLCSSVSTVTSLRTRGPTNLDSIFGSNRDSSPLPSVFFLKPTQPFNTCEAGVISTEIKRLGCEAECSPPSSRKITNTRSYISTPTSP